MRLGLTRPGLPAAYRSPFLGFEDLHFTSDDPEDDRFTGGGGGTGGTGRQQRRESEDDDSDDEEDDEDEDEDEEPKSRKKTKSTKARKAEDDEDDDDEDDKDSRPHRQAARYRTQLRAQQRENQELKDRLRALEDKDKKPDEVQSRNLTEAITRAEKAEGSVKTLTAQLAFFQANVVQWADPADAFALAEREGLFEDVMNEDGTVDTRELRRGLRDLARRKKYLVKSTEDDPKARGRKSTDDDSDDDEEDDEEEPRSRRSAPTMNGSRKGKRQAGPSREQLASKFPVLNRM